MREHIPKRHLDFENPIQAKAFDNTKDRIHGVQVNDPFVASSSVWGTTRNPASDIPRVGLKSQQFEKQIAAQVAQEMAALDEQKERLRQVRHFDTWQRSAFTEKDLTANLVGRKVMRTQDGQECGMDKRDDQFIVENGLWHRTQKASDDALKQRVPTGHYAQQTPVTIYTEALERKNFYQSASTGTNPFGITRGFTQPVQSTKAVQGYEGNIAFDREQEVFARMRSTGTKC